MSAYCLYFFGGFSEGLNNARRNLHTVRHLRGSVKVRLMAVNVIRRCFYYIFQSVVICPSVPPHRTCRPVQPWRKANLSTELKSKSGLVCLNTGLTASPYPQKRNKFVPGTSRGSSNIVF